MSGHEEIRGLVTRAKVVLELVRGEPTMIHVLDAHEVHDVLKGFVQGVPRLLAELEEDGENADYWRQRADELGGQLEDLRSAVRSLFSPSGRMVSAAPGTYRNLWSLVANNTDTCRGPDGQATRTETNQ